MLNLKTVTCHEVLATDLDDFISAVYDVEYNTMDDQEMEPDQVKTMRTVKKGDLDSHDSSYFDHYRENGHFRHHSLNAILADLCNRDLIPEGKYLVRAPY